MTKITWFALSLLLLTGCNSLHEPSSASFASVVIAAQPPEAIKTATEHVFAENGYANYPTGPTTMIFEKEGSRMNDIAYNGVVGTHYGQGTLVRVKTELVPLADGSFRLRCQAFMVRNAGDSFFAEEIRVKNFRSGPYQKLLDDVAKRLKQ